MKPLAVVMDMQTMKVMHDLPVNCQTHCVTSTNVIYYKQTLLISGPILKSVVLEQFVLLLNLFSFFFFVVICT